MNSRSLVLNPPWLFKLAKWMQRKHIRGGYRLLDFVENSGLLDHVVRYQLNNKITIDVPLYRTANRWDLDSVLDYDVPTVNVLADAINRFTEPVVFVDCGADIGVMSVLVALKTSNIERFIGIEPNSAAFEILEQNYSRLPFRTRAILGAVSDFNGLGELASPDYYPKDDHAKYLVQSETGKISVYRIDDLGITAGKYIALKLDVEGAEFDAIKGATQTLLDAKGFVADIEAHPKVASRTGIDPIVVLRKLNAIRPCQFSICERPDVTLDLDRGFFEQVDAINHDVVAVSFQKM